MNKFHDIFLDLEANILADKYPVASLLPSENQLMKHFGVSRETIRKALALLINAGYIQKKQGKGSIVLNYHKFDFPISGLTSYKELQEAQHMYSKTIIAELSLQRVPENLAQLTGWKVNDTIWKLVRKREINGETVILDKDFLLKSIIPDLPLDEAENSIYRYFEDDLDLKIGYAQKEITVEPVTDEDLALMDLNAHTHVVVVRSVVYLEDTRCFEYTESRHRLDMFKFVDFARRRKMN
ncbi:trehalose operon repressor [Listeria costaricensis]|uniref:trehalose operon repressor n=1 Tax=Listeria costaricensis TaxID=2026604 RepID=UPI000C071D43|nr:trehalose operon repressor [Listeria costaricensis]